MTDDELNRLLDTLQKQSVAAGMETRKYFDETVQRLAEESRRHFEVSAEGVKQEVRIVAEAVLRLNERIGHEVGRVDEKIDRGFADTQAMIKFSHAELERRVRMLEQAFSELQSRVERLESTTH